MKTVLEQWQKVDIFGQIRFRQETDSERINRRTGNRQQIRFRIGANYTMTPELRIGGRLTTGGRRSSLVPIDRGGAPLSYQDTGDMLDKIEVQQDSVFTPVSQDDFLRTTNFRGHRFGGLVNVWKNVDVRLSFLSGRPIDPIAGQTKEEWRGRIDLTGNW